MSTTPPKPKRVLIVGAGAAGMSCAHHLAAHPSQFAPTLIDATPRCGGQAFSIPLNLTTHHAPFLNQGVQGGSPAFHHTLTMLARQGHTAIPVHLQVSFGRRDLFWTNVFPSRLFSPDRHGREARRFSSMLKIVRMFEFCFALLPIRILMKLFRFSAEFANAVTLPMVALFLGTGNVTPEVPSVFLERLCTSESVGMWYPPDKNVVASNIPAMFVFPDLGAFYEDWKGDLVEKGVEVRLCTELTRVVRRDGTGVTVELVDKNSGVKTEEHFDELVLCVLADKAAELLSPTSTFLTRRILASAKFSNDLTITHTDAAYMRKHYETTYDPSLAADPSQTPPQFQPMYLTYSYPQDPSKLELSFDCTAYQAQFIPSSPDGIDGHVFQSIFLNEERDGHLWTADQIDPSTIIRQDRWHQLCHSWTHYAFVVPWLWMIQGRRHTRVAGSWTLVNAHEAAVVSGIAAAVDLGARYPEDLERDRWALFVFRLYYLLVYGRWYRKRAAPEGEGKDWAGGNKYGSLYQGPGLTKEGRQVWRDQGT